MGGAASQGAAAVRPSQLSRKSCKFLTGRGETSRRVSEALPKSGFQGRHGGGASVRTMTEILHTRIRMAAFLRRTDSITFSLRSSIARRVIALVCLVLAWSCAVTQTVAEDTEPEDASEISDSDSVFAKDFVDMAIAPNAWVVAYEQLELIRANDNSYMLTLPFGAPLPYFVRGSRVVAIDEALSSSADWPQRRVLKRWQSPVLFARTGNEIVDDQINRLISNFSSFPDIPTIKLVQESDANAFIDIAAGPNHEDRDLPAYSNTRYCLSRGCTNFFTDKGFPNLGFRPYLLEENFLFRMREVGLGQWNYFRDATRFTPYGLFHPEGFLITDSDSKIVFAQCFVNGNATETLLRELVSECFLRTLGLPGVSKHPYRSPLGKRIRSTSDVRPWPRIEGPYLPSISDHELLLVSVLYHPLMSPGMSRENVLARAAIALKGARKQVQPDTVR